MTNVARNTQPFISTESRQYRFDLLKQLEQFVRQPDTDSAEQSYAKQALDFLDKNHNWNDAENQNGHIKSSIFLLDNSGKNMLLQKNPYNHQWLPVSVKIEENDAPINLAKNAAQKITATDVNLLHNGAIISVYSYFAETTENEDSNHLVIDICYAGKSTAEFAHAYPSDLKAFSIDNITNNLLVERLLKKTA